MTTLYYCRVDGAGSGAEHQAAHGLLLWAAAQRWPEVGRSPALAKGKNGKPYFAEFPDHHFNLSHSGGWVACALSDCPVGIDIQGVRRNSPVRRKLTPQEQDWLQGQPEGAFTALWVKKEAYLKCTGAGLTRRLDSFPVLPLGENEPEPGLRNRLIPFPVPTLSCAVCGGDALDLSWNEWKGAVSF